MFVIVHLLLDGIPSAGSPPRVLYKYLKAYFREGNDLLYEEVVFNLADDDAEQAHYDTMAALAKKLRRYLIYYYPTIQLFLS
jgi:hypothetical protein